MDYICLENHNLGLRINTSICLLCLLLSIAHEYLAESTKEPWLPNTTFFTKCSKQVMEKAKIWYYWALSFGASMAPVFLGFLPISLALPRSALLRPATGLLAMSVWQSYWEMAVFMASTCPFCMTNFLWVTSKTYTTIFVLTTPKIHIHNLVLSCGARPVYSTA